MNLIRNGGFELGNTLHWIISHSHLLEVDDSNQKYGDYCGKVTSVGGGAVYMSNEDYINVVGVSIMRMGLWLTSAAGRNIQIRAYEYNADGGLLQTSFSSGVVASAAYQREVVEVVLLPETVYIRLGFVIHGTVAGEVFYLDEGIIETPLGIYAGFRECLIADVSAATVSGNTSATPHDLREMNEYMADIHVSAVTGTNPTLDLTVVELDGNGQVTVIGTFAQKTATGIERIPLTSGIGKSIYAVYVIGGTTPAFTFKTTVTGKR